MIIAVDFDGTIVEHEFPEIGTPIPYAIEVIKEAYKQGHNFILWTCREGKDLDRAVFWLERELRIPFAINENYDKTVSFGKRKVYADWYIDDRSTYPHQTPDWLQIGLKLIGDSWYEEKISKMIEESLQK